MREIYNSTFVYLKNFVLLYFWILDSGFRIPDSGFRIPGSGFRIPDSGLRIPAFRVALIMMASSSHLLFILTDTMVMRDRPKHPGPVLGLSP